MSPEILNPLKKQPLKYQLFFWGTKLVILALVVYFLFKLKHVLS